jgi:hypothetical protein
MRDLGVTYRAAGVRALYLVHGTFVGDDALGFFSDVARAFPNASRAMRNVGKSLVDAAVGQRGNYDESYAELLEQSLADGPSPPIPVRRVLWSSQNHHVGRADGAIRLLDLLSQVSIEPHQRIQLWGHSHAGNVLALMTNLLGSPPRDVERFFDAAQSYYRWPGLGKIDLPHWQRMRTLLAEEDHPLRRVALDLVTFGTPIRYGWETSGYARLLHIVHHRPASGVAPYCVKFPPDWHRALKQLDGDTIQQLGIAGTNTPPRFWAWRTWMADRRLHRLLQASVASSDLLRHCQAGQRVPREGTTLLVDYQLEPESIAQHHVGHAIYTKQAWMLFHAEQVARHFYGLNEAA